MFWFMVGLVVDILKLEIFLSQSARDAFSSVYCDVNVIVNCVK